MILGILMTGGSEGCGMYAEEGEALKEICPACKKELMKEIEKDEAGGFSYILKCERHGIMKHRKPTYS